MNPLVTLSIVSHGDSEKVSQLLNGIQNHEITKKIQLILTDNLVNELPDFDPSPWASLHLIRNPKPLGFSKNHNNAFEHAQGIYFVIMNPDLIFEAPVIDSLIQTLETHKADLIAPQIVDEKGIIQDSYRRLPTPLKLIKRRLLGESVESFQADHHGFIYPDWIAGMFWLMKSETYRQLGGLDEKFRLYFEDVDFCTRARLQGKKIVVDSNHKVRHDAQRSSRKRLYYLALHTMSAIKFFSSDVYRRARR